MIMKIFLFLLCCVMFVGKLNANDICVIPKPQHMKVKEGVNFTLSESVVVYASPSAMRTASMWVEFVNSALPFDLQLKETSRVDIESGILFSLPESPDDSEAYSLDIDSRRIMMRSSGEAGLFYASQTMNQLLPAQIMGESMALKIIHMPSVSIKDEPRFKWRGFMLDVSRTFYPIDVLKKYIDIISHYKINTFHLHLTDDQGWRIEIKKHPELTAEKATTFPAEFGQPASRSGYYTQEQLKDLVAYAQQRNISIVPEIDVPGHSWPVVISYPELAVHEKVYPDYVMPFLDSYHVWSDQFTPNLLDPTNEKVYEFLDDVFTEVAEIFPSDFIHFGGDEVKHEIWDGSEKVQQFMQFKGICTAEDLQSYFVRRVSDIITSKGKKPMGWNDILSDADKLYRDTHIMSWRGSGSIKDAAKYGFPVVASPTSNLYFDIRQGSQNDGTLADLAYHDPVLLKDVYGYEPTEGLRKAEAECLLGVQANMWTHVAQTVKEMNIQLFPRLLALSEIAWSDKKKDFSDFKNRLQKHYPRLDAMKVDYFKSDCHIIGTWNPGCLADDCVDLEWDVTHKVYADGRAMAGLYYTYGDHRLNIHGMQLLEDGKVIAEDLHEGFADETRATSKYKTYLYYLDIKDYKEGSKYTLRVKVSGQKGNDSYGNVIFSLSPYEPFSAVETTICQSSSQILL